MRAKGGREGGGEGMGGAKEGRAGAWCAASWPESLKLTVLSHLPQATVLLSRTTLEATVLLLTVAHCCCYLP